MSTKKLDMGIYPFSVTVYTSRRKMARRMEKRGFDPLEDFPDHAQGLSIRDNNVFLVFAKDDVTLVHELIHVGLLSLEAVGIDAHSNQGECLTYLVDFMFEHFKEK